MPYMIALLTLVNMIGLVVVGVDKHKARKRLWRIPEKVFFTLSILGGCPGVYLGLLLFRHKTKHWYFILGIPAIFILQMIVLYYFISSGFLPLASDFLN